MKLTQLFDGDGERAVSPVIGVILMVAITVILAAVIGTFVLGLGDQIGDTGPQAAFSANADSFDDDTDILTVDIQKTGGETLEVDDLTIVIGDEQIAADEDTRDNLATGGTWASGTTATFESEDSDYESGDRVDVSIRHDPSGDLIFRSAVTVP